MEKNITKEMDFILEPTYSKISKSINNITKELINIVGTQYSSIINERISRTNFVFFNKVTDLKKYCEENKNNIKDNDNKKVAEIYETTIKNIANYKNKITRLNKKLSTNFILEIQNELSHKDKEYLKKNKKIDLTKLECYKVFFDDNDKNLLINGLITYFFHEYEIKLKDKRTTINEIENIYNHREKCLKILGVKNINIRSFDINSLNNLFNIINKYNNEYKKEYEELNLDKNKIINEYLLNDKLLKDTKNEKVSKYFTDLLKKDKQEINKINEKIISRMLKLKEPEIVWALDNYSDDNNMKFLLFSPTVDYENNDFLFIKQICCSAFNYENYNAYSIVQDNAIIGKDRYLKFGNLIIDFIAYQITKKLNENKAIIINHKKNNNIDLNDGLFLVERFYLDFNNSIIESIINNDNKYIYGQIGKSNYENFINIINRFYYDSHGNLIPDKERKKEIFVTSTKNLLNLSLDNMEQYRRILINKEKYFQSGE